MSSIIFRGKSIPVTTAEAPDADVALGTDLLKNWLDSLDESMDLKSIEIQSVDRFRSSRIGFVKIKANIERNGVQIPGIVQLRGSAVAMLLVLTDEQTNEQYTILTHQPRVPTGRILFELPAGMTDGEGNLRGVAIRELEEECGIKVSSDELIDLTELTYDGKAQGIFTSPGLLDEFLRIFACKKKMHHEEIRALEGKLGGNSPHEQIVLKIVKLSDVWKFTSDVMALSALYLYQQLQNEGKV
ncbi:hydrolase, NUDIX family protein [Tritrichomonas foetus]|uniref:Hydrolase, NUDIX family protein n=1 Tax=Tritrichomonas foetus TaxID=1144522 RepID=A0A1J4J934_9EUKA|nr:hydrolase, NUDIX family protein [Tritrichomonas foetus]|eukprot:OHS94759.1 hydrolase, NUDIX family protein [Tritrichomonas foetus]